MHIYQYHVIIQPDNISKESSLKTYYKNAKKGEQCPLSNTPWVTKPQTAAVINSSNKVPSWVVSPTATLKKSTYLQRPMLIRPRISGH